MSRDKSGLLGFDMVNWIIRIIFFTAVVISMIFLIKMLQVDNINVDTLQNYVIQNRVLYAYDGISYFDIDSNRVYPGIINPETISQQIQTNLDLGDYKNYLGMKFVLAYGSKSDDLWDKFETYYYNEDRFTLLEPLVNINGPGGAKVFKTEDNVLVCSKNCLTEPENLRKGKLIITILRPNS